MKVKKIYDWYGSGGSEPFNPQSIQGKFAGWWKEEAANYITDQLGTQNRESLLQNSLPGQVFPGRAVQYGSNKLSSTTDAGGLLDIEAFPFSISLSITFNTFVGFSANVTGKRLNSNVNGEYWFSTSSGGLQFNVRSGGATLTITVVNTVVASTEYHVIVTIDGSGTLRSYTNNVLNASTATVTTLTRTNLNFVLSGTQSGAYGGQVTLRDVRVFKSKLLSATEREACLNGRHVSGFTDWWMCSDNSSTTLHSAKNGGLHLTHSPSAPTFVTGYFPQPYNDYGYAEHATRGQIPPDMTNLDGSGIPLTDCVGTSLIFRSNPKLHLSKSGSDLVMPANNFKTSQITNLINAAQVLGFNTWYSSGSPQSVSAASVAPYCAARQFYNSTTKELIILKEYEDYVDNNGVTRKRVVTITAEEESRLYQYFGLSTRAHAYNSDASTYFSTLNTPLSDLEKSSLDNVFRVSAGFRSKLSGWMLPVPGGFNNMKKNLITNTFDLIDNALGDVTYGEGKGIAGQTGSYRNGFNASTDAKFLQNDAHFSFKLSDNFEVPFGSNNGGYIFGAFSQAAPTITARFAYDATANIILQFQLNSTGTSGGSVNGYDINSTFVCNRTASNATNFYARRTQVSTGSTASTGRPNLEWFVGNAKDSGGFQPGSGCMNWVSALSWGGSLTAAESQLMTVITDVYCDDVKTRNATNILTASGFTYELKTKYFADRLGNQVIWSDYFRLYYSTDGGETVAASIAFSNATFGWLHMAHIFDNGKIIIGTSKNKWYKTTTSLSSLTEITPTKNGSPYTIHTPANATYPGEYTKFIGINKKMYLNDGREIFVYNNYGTSLRGPAPALLLYSFGDEIKVGYEFGTNPYLRDNGSPNGSTTGTFLGDAAVSNWCRHGHGAQQRPDNLNKFISMWGDLDRNALAPAVSNFQECKFMEHTYDPIGDTWTHSIIKEGGQNSRWKATSGMMPGDGNIYWTSDAGVTGSNQSELGYFKSPIATLGVSGDTRFYQPLNLTKPSNMFHLDSGNRFVGGGYAATGGTSHGGFFDKPNIIWSPDMVTFNEVALNIPGNVYVFKITKLSATDYQLDLMSDYDYTLGAQSLILRFNS